MTRVDFYIVAAAGDARLAVACRIADKAVQGGQRVFVCAGDEAEARRLDDLLWTFADGSFLPHRLVAAGGNGQSLPAEPVLVGFAMRDSCGDVLINLSSLLPERIHDYARVAEIVDSDPLRRQQGRERYRYYRGLGLEPVTHSV